MSYDETSAQLLRENKELTGRLAELERRNAMLVDVLKRASTSLGAFCSDEGWSMEDMNTLDSVDAVLATISDKK